MQVMTAPIPKLTLDFGFPKPILGFGRTLAVINSVCASDIV